MKYFRCLLSLPVSFCRIVVWCLHSSHYTASPSSATRSPVYFPFSSNPSPVAILFMLSIICLSSSTFQTSLATTLHPLHANTREPPRISTQELVHPELSKSTQLLQVPQTKCLLAIVLLIRAIPRSIESIDCSL